jgi:hypothetical protein
MATPRSSAVTERVWSRLPEGSRQVLEDELSPSDLQSLLLSLTHSRAHRIRPAEVRLGPNGSTAVDHASGLLAAGPG